MSNFFTFLTAGEGNGVVYGTHNGSEVATISFIETELAQAHHTLKNAMQRDLTGVHMGKQVWGTFSVKDHCDPGAFVAEVMLYDRLVIPNHPTPENERDGIASIGIRPGWIQSWRFWAIGLFRSSGMRRARQAGEVAMRPGSR